jgi:hypothetical protein
MKGQKRLRNDMYITVTKTWNRTMAMLDKSYEDVTEAIV